MRHEKTYPMPDGFMLSFELEDDELVMHWLPRHPNIAELPNPRLFERRQREALIDFLAGVEHYSPHAAEGELKVRIAA